MWDTIGLQYLLLNIQFKIFIALLRENMPLHSVCMTQDAGIASLQLCSTTDLKMDVWNLMFIKIFICPSWLLQITYTFLLLRSTLGLLFYVLLCGLFFVLLGFLLFYLFALCLRNKNVTFVLTIMEHSSMTLTPKSCMTLSVHFDNWLMINDWSTCNHRCSYHINCEVTSISKVTNFFFCHGLLFVI